MGRKKKEELPPPPPRLISKQAAEAITDDLARLLHEGFYAYGFMVDRGIWQIVDDDCIEIPTDDNSGPDVRKEVVLAPVEVIIKEKEPKIYEFPLKTARLLEKEIREELGDPSLKVIEAMVRQGKWIITDYNE